MKAATVCSGIGAPEVAMPHWTWTLQSEIEDAPRQVLKHRHHAQDARYPRASGPALWGDFTTIRVRHLRRLGIDLPEWLIAGTPCQAFSLAGLRKSMSDARGNLTMEFVRLVHSIRRAGSLRGVVWENVPGVLSTKDNAFGCLLGGLVGSDHPLPRPGGGAWPESGMVAGPWARVAWRVLDAQHFGVPQQRARVLLVASFVEGGDPAAILFERRSLRGNPAKGRKARKEIAGTLTVGSRNGGGGPGARTDEAASGYLQPAVVGALTADAFSGGAGGRPEGAAAGHFLPVVTHSLRAEGFDASEDGSGRGTPIVPVICPTLQAGGNSTGGDRPPGTSVDTANSLIVMAHGQAGAEIAFDQSPTLTCNHEAPICFSAKDYGADALEDCAPVLRSGNHDGSHQNGGVMPAVAGTMGVRRLMPVECERLQGFEDDFTLVPNSRGKPMADGPRYKMLGNSKAVPVIRWVLERVEDDEQRISNAR